MQAKSGFDWVKQVKSNNATHVEHFHEALSKIARHVGVKHDPTSPGLTATLICNAFDARPPSREQKTMPPGSEVRPISANIRKIDLKGVVDIELSQGPEPKMEVFANDASLLHKILTSAFNDRLSVDNDPIVIADDGKHGRQISFGSNSVQIGKVFYGSQKADVNNRMIYSGEPGFKVVITLPDVSSVKVSGAGKFVYKEIEQDELNLDISGSGSIKTSGNVKRLEAEVSGAGKVSASSLKAAQGRLSVSGAGTIKAHVTESVVARVSGAGTVKIEGSPAQRDTKVSGIGEIRFA